MYCFSPGTHAKTSLAFFNDTSGRKLAATFVEEELSWNWLLPSLFWQLKRGCFRSSSAKQPMIYT